MNPKEPRASVYDSSSGRSWKARDLFFGAKTEKNLQQKKVYIYFGARIFEGKGKGVELYNILWLFDTVRLSGFCWKWPLSGWRPLYYTGLSEHFFATTPLLRRGAPIFDPQTGFFNKTLGFSKHGRFLSPPNSLPALLGGRGALIAPCITGLRQSYLWGEINCCRLVKLPKLHKLTRYSPSCKLTSQKPYVLGCRGWVLLCVHSQLMSVGHFDFQDIFTPAPQRKCPQNNFHFAINVH